MLQSAVLAIFLLSSETLTNTNAYSPSQRSSRRTDYFLDVIGDIMRNTVLWKGDTSTLQDIDTWDMIEGANNGKSSVDEEGDGVEVLGADF
jgi:hypothetical protein